MTEQQERRPFLALADHELELILTALFSEAARASVSLTLEYNRIAEVVWQELRRRRADARSLREGNFPDPQRCDNFSTPPPELLFRPVQCEGVEGHNGPHFAANRHGQRKEWR